MKSCEIIFISEKYLVEIITGVKILKDNSIMSFKRLFDNEVSISEKIAFNHWLYYLDMVINIYCVINLDNPAE